MFSIRVFPSGPFATNAIVVSCSATKKTLIIDPAPESAEAIFSCVKEDELDPIAIVLTHSHMDHIGDVAAVKKALSLPVWIHETDAPNLEKPGADGLPLFFPIEGVRPDKFLAEGDTVEAGELHFRIIHTPGHTPGGICLYDAKAALLISGDTLFQGSIGNLSFPGANAEAMWASLDKLAALPPETKVYPGHGEATTIGAEHWLPRAREIFGS